MKGNQRYCLESLLPSYFKSVSQVSVPIFFSQIVLKGEMHIHAICHNGIILLLYDYALCYQATTFPIAIGGWQLSGAANWNPGLN